MESWNAFSRKISRSDEATESEHQTRLIKRDNLIVTIMSFEFERPIGAPADVIELDYVSALHQTDVQGGIRRDSSIQDVDISLFLSSRYGIQESPDDIREKILSGLGSTDGYMDMMQLVSLLLIPTLREQQEQHKNGEEDGHTDMLKYTLEMMLHDVTGSRAPKPLTKTLVRQILQAYGESELSENDLVVREMLAQAGKESNHQLLLDTDTFCKALTNDVQQYDVKNKERLSTNFDDALFGESSRVTNEKHQHHAVQADQPRVLHLKRYQSTTPTVFEQEMTVDDIPLVYTAPHLDNAADTFRSKVLVVLQWSFFVLSFQAYLRNFIRGDFMGLRDNCSKYIYGAWAGNLRAFFCQVGVSVLRWLVTMLLMSTVGVVYFSLAGIGNFVECKNPIFPLIGMVFSLISTLLPWWFLGKDTTTEQDAAQEFLEAVTYCLGGCTVLVNMLQFVSILIPETSCLWDRFKWILVPGVIRIESRIKNASSSKINKVVTNALEVHRTKKQESVVPTHFGQALLNFAEMVPQRERVGSFCWTWRMILSRDMCRREGILLPGRLVSTNFAQFALAPFILISGIIITQSASNEMEEIVQIVSNAENFLNETSISLIGENISLESYIQSTEFAVSAALAFATTIAFITALAIALMVIPSWATIALQFRSGVIPFVDDPHVKMLRIAPDQTAYLKGCQYWAALFASIGMALLTGVIVFVFLWLPTAKHVQKVLTVIVGALLVLAIHIILVRSCRRVTSKAFYRMRPASANFTVLVRECGLLALTVGIVWVRILKLGLTMILYIGRVDTPFLHSQCGRVGDLRIDREPYMFQIDILQHEAHRHPYIETLGTMYMLMLRHRDEFCNEAGSCWRLIFVYILMPWLSKYRAMRRSRPLKLEDDIEGGATGGSSPVCSPPMRAVTLVDPQAYALRAVSLVPVASGTPFASSSTTVFGKRSLSLIDDDTTGEDKDEEIQRLQEEVLELKMQLQLQQVARPPPAAFNTPKHQTKFDSSTPKPGWEEDYEPSPSSEYDSSIKLAPQPHQVNVDDMVGHGSPRVCARAYKDTHRNHPSALKRKKSKGLPEMPPPESRQVAEVSWVDNVYKVKGNG